VSSATSRSKHDLLPEGGRVAGRDAEAFRTVDTVIAAADSQGRATPLRVLGRYRLLERLGSGGFGEVFRAQDELLRRQVAVKRIPIEADGIGERAAREAHAAARLSHPAIVALYEAAEQDGCFYLTSELVEGQTLARLVAQDVLSDEEIVEIGLVLCDALIHAHSRGVIHRDVKPQNIIVPDDPADCSGVAKLTDFGGARLDGEVALTATGDVLGTLAYMAPEQSEGRQAGPQADLYSLALVLYEALCGENPVRAATPAATVRRIGSDLPSLRSRRSDLPRDLIDAIDRALLAAPEDRGSLAELAGAARRALGDRSKRGGERLEEPWGQELSRATGVHDPVGSAWTSIGPQLRSGAAREQQPAAHARSWTAVLGADGDELPVAVEARGSQRLGAWLPSLPRLVWVAAVLALLGWQAASGRAGLALLLLAGTLPLLAAMPSRASVGWLLPALAPMLGLAGLASAFPAFASFPVRPRMRAWLGALGYWWLCLAQVGLGRGLAPAPGFSSGFPAGNAGNAWARPGWESSLSASAHAIGPLLSPAALVGAVLWALGAVLAPWLIRGRGAGIDLLLAGIWSAALLAGPGLLESFLQAGSAAATVPAGAILGAILGALVLVMSASRAHPPYRGYAAEPPHA
jgi:hypothetical protein